MKKNKTPSLKMIRESQFNNPINLTISCCFCGCKVGMVIVGSVITYDSEFHVDNQDYMWCLKCKELPEKKINKRKKELKTLDVGSEATRLKEEEMKGKDYVWTP